MRLLVVDSLPDAALNQLRSAGFELEVDASLKAERLQVAMAGFDPQIVVARSTRLNAGHLDAASSLELIIRAGAGVNTIDVAGAAGRGIFVSNCPGMNADAVAELVFGHLINADRHLVDNINALRAGQWVKKAQTKGRGLSGRVLGVLGMGAIGQAVASRARAFKMEVCAWSPSLDEQTALRLGVTRMASPLAVAQAADCLTVHVAYCTQTHHLVSRELLEALPDGAIVINTARGGVVDEAALAALARSKGLRAGFDVFEDEPGADGAWASPLLDAPGLYGTTHIAASTDQAQSAVADEACRVAQTYLETGLPPNCVNLVARTSATHMLVARHLDEVGALAAVLDRLRAANVNVQKIQNIIFEGDRAACARLQIDRVIDAEILREIEALPAVIAAKVIPI